MLIILFVGAWDVKLDPMGNVNHRVQFFLAGQSNATTITGVRGVTGTSANLLNSPDSLAFDSQLNIYVVDPYNLRIQKFLIEGVDVFLFQ